MVKHAPGYAGWVVVDRVTHWASKVYDFREQAEHRAKRLRRKMGKKPTSGTPTATP